MRYVWYLMSDVWLIISDVRCLMFDVWCVMSDVRCLKSEVGHLMSYVRCYKLDVWYMDDVWCLMSDIRRQMSDDRCLYVWMMTDVCCQKSDMWYMYVWRLMYDFLCLMYDVLCSIPGGKIIFHPHALTKEYSSYLLCILCFQECLKEVQSTNNKKWFISNNIIK